MDRTVPGKAGEPRDEIVFDEDTGAPIRRVTIRLKGRSDEEINADIEALFGEASHDPS